MNPSGSLLARLRDRLIAMIDHTVAATSRTPLVPKRTVKTGLAAIVSKNCNGVLLPVVGLHRFYLFLHRRPLVVYVALRS